MVSIDAQRGSGRAVIVADYVFQYLVSRDVRDVFMVSGGGIMHLVDALGRQPELSYWCNHNEQACAIAAEAYSRITGGVGVCLVTTGPGSTNALSGIAGAWVDSIPVVVLSGQVRTDLIADYGRLRQLGPQEVNIIDMARPVTKYATTVMAAEDIPFELEHAMEAALSGRPGPVWLNIPLDIQGADFEPSQSPGVRGMNLVSAESAGCSAQESDVARLIKDVKGARRPLIVCGNGVHLAGAEDLLLEFVERLDCPVVTTIGGMDLMPEAHLRYMGRFGPTGQRRANFAIQNADLLLCLGASMSVAAVGFDTSGLAPNARRLMVNIDQCEMEKPNLRVDESLAADVGWFMRESLRKTRIEQFAWDPRWLEACRQWKERYPLVTPDYLEDHEHVNSYYLAACLSDRLEPGDVVLTGDSLDAVSVFHSFAVKPHQRVITNSNYGAMGWDLPAAVGACVAREGARTILVTGDGSFQFNSQELLTIGHNRLNVKIFVLNNGGYESIRATQETHCQGRHVGCDARSGVGNPDFESLAAAYGLDYALLETNDVVDSALPDLLAGHGPLLCEVRVSWDQGRSPRIVSRLGRDGAFETPSLEHQHPFLPDDETKQIMGLFRNDPQNGDL